MTSKRRMFIAASAALATGLGGTGIAQAHGGKGGDKAPNPSAEKAHGKQGKKGGKRFGHKLRAVAAKLGVTPEALKAAIKDARHQRPALRRPDTGREAFTAALATELGVTADALKAAVEASKNVKGREARVEAIAKALGIETAKLTAAFDKVRADFKAKKQAFRESRADAFFTAVATKLGLEKDAVKAAFAEVYGKSIKQFKVAGLGHK